MRRLFTGIFALALLSSPVLTAQDTIPAPEKTKLQKFLGRLTVGGYGEVAMTRNFYSDNVYRYSQPEAHRGEQHGRFDIPHAVIFLGYDFGKGWSMQTEIEFEHLGTVLAFLLVLFTWFGVSYFLGGMHAYS